MPPLPVVVIVSVADDDVEFSRVSVAPDSVVVGEAVSVVVMVALLEALGDVVMDLEGAIDGEKDGVGFGVRELEVVGSRGHDAELVLGIELLTEIDGDGVVVIDVGHTMLSWAARGSGQYDTAALGIDAVMEAAVNRFPFSQEQLRRTYTLAGYCRRVRC